MTDVKHLGKTTEYSLQYDKTLLDPVNRDTNRKPVGLDDSNLPFVGYDVWNAYEWSCLLDNGMPITGILKLVYPCTSKAIIESKSLKLYLNSFNMTPMGPTFYDAVSKCINIIETDLSEVLQTSVHASIFPIKGYTPSSILPNAYDIINLDDLRVECNTYNVDSTLLQCEEICTKDDSTEPKTYIFNSLYSRCLHTGQPDHGTIIISYIPQSRKIIPESLLKYLISHRNHKMFHEPICEHTYKHILDVADPVNLAVGCLYCRRGGIDINAFRANSFTFLTKLFANCMNINTPSPKLPRQ